MPRAHGDLLHGPSIYYLATWILWATGSGLKQFEVLGFPGSQLSPVCGALESVVLGLGVVGKVSKPKVRQAPQREAGCSDPSLDGSELRYIGLCGLYRVHIGLCKIGLQCISEYIYIYTHIQKGMYVHTTVLARVSPEMLDWESAIP